MNPLVLILAGLIVFTWARWVRPSRSSPQGRSIATVPIPMLARARMHLVPGAMALVVAVALAVTDSAPWWIVVVPALSYGLLLLVPIRYVLTDAGIRLGPTEFRRWTEFAAVRRAPGGARLIGVQRGRGMHVWLSRSRGDDEFILFLKKTLQNAYKGARGEAFASPVQREPDLAGTGAGDRSPGNSSTFGTDWHVNEPLVTNQSALPSIETARH
jgi:hypothetical protein